MVLDLRLKSREKPEPNARIKNFKMNHGIADGSKETLQMGHIK